MVRHQRAKDALAAMSRKDRDDAGGGQRQDVARHRHPGGERTECGDDLVAVERRSQPLELEDVAETLGRLGRRVESKKGR